MIEARHARWAGGIFQPYLRRLMRKSFHAVRLLGEPPAPPCEKPVLVIANHGTWWDGFLVFLLNEEVLRRKLYVMMLEEQLRRYPFFRRLGAFGISQGHPRSVRAALSYSAEILKDPSHCVCIFPQGSMHRVHERPLGFRRGLRTILALVGAEVSIVPVAIACEFLGDRKPEAFLLADRTCTVSGSTFQGMDWLESVQLSQMDRLDAMIAAGKPGRALARGLGSGKSK
jgi:1-acyl-sn-glycerol-3-phosphate acyltransferase